MEKRKFTAPKNSYFAAANGYRGFRSYFDEVFAPQKFERLYVLKGGPGTGKSSLMKNLLSRFEEMGCCCEAVFCSSDPSSLDGVIIEKNKRKIAVLDGTAPHETDPRVPGAIDTIVNLGECWRTNILASKRTEILDLNAQKSRHYKAAYEYLHIAGIYYEHIKKIINSAYNEEVRTFVAKIIRNNQEIKRGSECNVRLRSSFGKHGHTELPLENNIQNASYSVVGKYGSEYIFMRYALSWIKENNILITRYPSPYLDEDTEVLVGSDLVIATGADFKEEIDTTAFLDEKILSKEEERLSFYTEQKAMLMRLAQKEFSSASDAHFALESIYTPVMNFEEIDAICEKLKFEIEKLISPN